MLLESNPSLGLKDGIYQNTNEIFRDSTLSNYIQIAVAEVFDEAPDKSLFSLDVERLCNTDELRQALSTSQYRFLQSFDLSKVNTVLDICEDFGGVAHFLADQVAQVEALKVDPSRALLANNRCANKPNVKHVSEDLDKLVFAPGHYDLIIIGELEALGLSKQQLSDLLAKLQAALSPHGTLVMNALNSSRLSKWFDAPSELSENSLAFVDLYASASAANDGNAAICKELDRKQLRDLLLANNFSAVDVHANFSKNRDCKNLLSEDYLTASVNGLNHFYRLGSISNSEVNEYLIYQKLVAEKRNLVDFANRYVVIAGAGSKHVRALYDNDFSHFPGTGRKPQWRTITARARAAHNVEKTRVYPSNTNDLGLVTQNLSPQPFYKGRALVSDWLNALLTNDHRRFSWLVDEYAQWLDERANPDMFHQTAYDLLPFNIVLNERGGERQFQLIDTEWQLNCGFSADFVLFRALFWFAFENKTLLRAFSKEHDIFSLGMFVVSHMPNVHDIDALTPFIELEERVQAEIDNKFRANAVKHALLQSFDDSGLAAEQDLYLQVAWSNEQGLVDEQNAKVSTWEKRVEEQEVVVSLAAFDQTRSVLRLDPMASSGAFSLSAIDIVDAEGKSLWKLASRDEIVHASLTQTGLKLVGENFIALNQDPYFLFDLGAVAGIKQAARLKATLAWHWGQNYSRTLDSLSQAISTQNSAIIGQSHRLNQNRADIEYKDQRIEDLLEHRRDLTNMLKDEERRGRQNKARLQGELEHLKARLHAQHAHGL